jgi:hypothetical protein
MAHLFFPAARRTAGVQTAPAALTLAGDSSTAKTALLLQYAYNAALRGEPIASERGSPARWPAFCMPKRTAQEAQAGARLSTKKGKARRPCTTQSAVLRCACRRSRKRCGVRADSPRIAKKDTGRLALRSWRPSASVPCRACICSFRRAALCCVRVIVILIRN